jgi:hypothetical protein
MTAALGFAAPAGAEPGDNPCQFAATFLCKFVPMVPDLDHDIDLTQQPGTVDSEPVPSQAAGGPSPDAGPSAR